MKKLFVAIITLCIFGQLERVRAQVDQTKYSIEELHEDWDIFRSELERMHAGLYIYTDTAEMDAAFNAVKSQINRPMTAAEFYPYMAKMNAYIQNGHTVIRPSEKFDEYVANKAPIFPLDIHWHGDSLFVLRNMTDEKALEPGSYISKINGQDAWQVFSDIASQWNRDGANTSFPRGIVARAFAEIYANFRGFPEMFELEITDSQGTTHQVSIAPIPADVRNELRTEKYGEVKYYWDKSEGDALTLHFEDDIAVLTLRHCGNTDVRKFMKSIKAQYRKIFKEIEASGAEHLIIDIRNNPGGNEKPTIHLLRHLTDQPFFVYASNYIVGRKINKYYKAPRWYYNALGGLVLKKKADQSYETNWLGNLIYGKLQGKKNQPAAEQFKGQIYTLTNYATFSAGGYLASMLREHTNSIFIGEEPGGNAIECVAGQYFDLVLLNTQNRVLMQIVHSSITVSHENNGHGVQPDYPIRPTVQQLVNGEDPEVEKVKALINAKKKTDSDVAGIAGKQ